MRQNKLKAKIIRMDASATYERVRDLIKTATRRAASLKDMGGNYDAMLKLINKMLFNAKDKKDKDAVVSMIRDCMQSIDSLKQAVNKFEDIMGELKVQVFIDRE